MLMLLCNGIVTGRQMFIAGPYSVSVETDVGSYSICYINIIHIHFFMEFILHTKCQ